MNIEIADVAIPCDGCRGPVEFETALVIYRKPEDALFCAECKRKLERIFELLVEIEEQEMLSTPTRLVC